MSYYGYNDVYAECNTTRKVEPFQKICFVICVALAAFTAFNWIASGSIAMSVPFIVLLIITWFLWSNMRRGYEIELTNENIEVTQIRRKRKSLLAFTIDELVVIAPSRTDPVKDYIGKMMETHDCTSHEKAVKYYCMIVKQQTTEKEVKFLVELTPEFLEAVKRQAPQKVYE